MRTPIRIAIGIAVGLGVGGSRAVRCLDIEFMHVLERGRGQSSLIAQMQFAVNNLQRNLDSASS